MYFQQYFYLKNEWKNYVADLGWKIGIQEVGTILIVVDLDINRKPSQEKIIPCKLIHILDNNQNTIEQQEINNFVLYKHTFS